MGRKFVGEESTGHKFADIFSHFFRIVLFMFNGVIFIIGIGVFGYGVYLHKYLETYPSVGGKFPISAAIIAMCIGGIMSIISFFGCCGTTSKRFSKMLIIYGTLMMIVLIAELGTALYGYLYKSDAKMLLEKQMKHSLHSYDARLSYNSVWDKLQQNYQCCGIGQLRHDSKLGYLDWKNTTWHAENRGSVPRSCCKNQDIPTCGLGQIDKMHTNSTNSPIYTNGCLNEFYVWLKTNIELAAGTFLGTFFLQCVIIVTAFTLGKIKQNITFVLPNSWLIK